MNRSLKHLFLLIALAVPAGLAANVSAETPAATAGKQTPKAIPLSGKVLETMDGGGYTYVLLKNGGENVWVAAPQMKVKVGQELTLLPGFEIKNFSSKGLNRKFDKVIFSAGLANESLKLSPSALKMAHEGMPQEAQKGAAPAKAEKPAPAAPAAKAAKAAPAAAKKAEAPPVILIPATKPAPVSHQKIQKAKGANTYTIAQLYAKKGELEKKPVVVRGKVMKVTSRIMKKNWIHIQDGSGSEAKKNHNLVVTTKTLPKVGDVVTVTGKIYNNVDFGYGYKYALMVQDAQVK